MTLRFRDITAQISSLIRFFLLENLLRLLIRNEVFKKFLSVPNFQ